MSAIGEYVHLYASNYLTYGISRFGHEPNLNAYAAILQQRQNTQNLINQKLTIANKKQIEKGINNIFSNKKGSPNSNIEFSIVQAVNDTIKKKLQQASFGSTEKFTAISKSSTLINTNRKNIRLTTILNKINDIEQKIKTLSRQRAPKAQELKKYIEDIYSSLAKIISKENFSKDELALLKSHDIERIQQMIGRKSFLTQDIEGLASMINTTLKTFNIPSATAIEFVTDNNKIISASKKKALEAIEKELGTFFDMKNFSDMVDLSLINQTYDDGHTFAQTRLAGNNFIMELRWNEIAVKPNFSIEKDAFNNQYILQDNLKQILSLLNNTDLVNHWLNLKVSHYQMQKKWILEKDTNTGKTKSIIVAEPNLSIIHYQGLEETLYNAIAAMMVKQQLNKNSVFIVKGEQYKVYDLGDLLTKTALKSNLEMNFSFSNKRAATVETRLKRLVDTLHKNKIRLIIKPDIMQQGFYN